MAGTATKKAPADVPLRGVRLGQHEVGRPLRRVPGLGHRGAAGPAAGLPARSRPGDQPGACRSRRCRGAQRQPLDGHLRARPRARWRHRARAACVLLAGEPGVGKSTLLLEVAAQAARRGATTLYVTGEESAAQVRLRAERTDALEDTLLLAAEVELSAVLGHIETVRPDLLVIDSVADHRLRRHRLDARRRHPGPCGHRGSGPGRQAAARCRPCSSVTSPRTARSPVHARSSTWSTSCSSSRASATPRLRVLRAVKNRFGPVDEIGCFDISVDGIVEVADATGLFISRHASPMAGTCVTVTLEGRRPLLAEVQALVTSERRRPAPPVGRAVWTRPGWPCCSPYCSDTSACGARPRTSTRRPSAAPRYVRRGRSGGRARLWSARTPAVAATPAAGRHRRGRAGR